MVSSTHRGVGESDAPVASSRSRVISDAAQLLQGKHRRARGMFLLEGLQGVREAVADPDVVERLFATPGAAQAHPNVLAAAKAVGAAVTICDDQALRRLATSVNPVGLVALCRMPAPDLSTVLSRARLVVYLHQLADPGNLGTIIRTADAAGADAVLLSPESVDPFNDKALRSTAGSICHIPVIRDLTLDDALAHTRGIGAAVFAATAEGTALDAATVQSRLSGPTLWIFGSEAHGLPPEVLAKADLAVSVPHFGRAESLNVSSAAAVCVYASALAQRRG